ncbi:16S rRNA (guanine(527)-N(7))-methyltransferase RsmG [bacterium]|nr:MAG: 16S rRNA (guanine(527)-N(7))-methyltransferase RsmG [bacterium]
MNNTLDGFFQHIDKHMFETTDVQKNQFNAFYNILVEWNSKINLISRNEKNIVDRHFLNSSCIAHFIKFNPDDKIIDLGSGGGFPGIILKILFPQSYFTLVDSVRKKTDFLRLVVRDLGLTKIDIINDRAEEISSMKKFYNSFDYVTARAVSSLKDLVGLSKPFLKENGNMVFLKGRSYADEITAASVEPRQLKIHKLFSIAESQDGVLLVISAY